MRIPIASLALLLLIATDNTAEGVSTKGTTAKPVTKVESPETSVGVGAASDKVSTSGTKQSSKPDTTDDKKDVVSDSKPTAESPDGSPPGSESNNNNGNPGGVEEFPEQNHFDDKRCSGIICKLPPSDAHCDHLPENPAVSILGAVGDCCPFLICTRPDGSFFSHYAGAHVDNVRQNSPPMFMPHPMMPSFIQGVPIWQNQFGGFRPPPPIFPFGFLAQNLNQYPNSRPFSAELQITMGRRFNVPLSMQQQRQQERPVQNPFQQQPNLQPTMDKDSLHPTWNDVSRERRSNNFGFGFFNGNPVQNPFVPSGFSPLQPGFRGQALPSF